MISSSSCGEATSVLLIMMNVVGMAVVVIVAMMVTKAMMPLLSPAAASVTELYALEIVAEHLARRDTSRARHLGD